jgi:hypothetical protein
VKGLVEPIICFFPERYCLLVQRLVKVECL